MLSGRVVLTCLSSIAILVPSPAVPAASETTELIRTAVELPCQAKTVPALRALAERLPSARFKSSWVDYSLNRLQHAEPGITGRRLVFAVGDDELVIKFTGLIGSPDYVDARYFAGAARHPLFLATADHSCTIHTARGVTYDAAGRPEWLQDLDSRLRPVGEPEPLNPPVPAGIDSPGVPIGLIDSGVNYLLPAIAAGLARSPEGEILGYDYWDLDRRPFDISLIPDPFFPGHHGTLTASLVLEGAPVAKLVPYRYPRQDMARMAALVDDAAARGVRVMNLSLVSQNRAEWLPFEAAAAAHPEMLFVVAAGNYGRDIERQPHYPASFTLANMVVVTSATADGRLTDGVNWGARSVDLMVPGENVVPLDFDGERRPVSGSSYATARATALAACLLAEHPELSTAGLKAALFKEARPSEAREVAEGFVPDAALKNRGACGPRHVGMRAPTNPARGAAASPRSLIDGSWLARSLAKKAGPHQLDGREKILTRSWPRETARSGRTRDNVPRRG
jgi:subtilisin family serine protease